MRKALSMLLACLLMFGSLAVPVYAEDIPGQNELEVSMYRSWQTDVVYDVKVLCEDGTELESTIGNSRVATTTKISTVFLNVPNGAHEVVITAPNHLEFRQTLVFDNTSAVLNLTNNHALNDEGKFGVMPAGDIDNNGVIDDTDAELALDSGIDFTGDGQVDLQDLAVVVRNSDGPVEAPVVYYTVPSIETEDGTIVEENQDAPGVILSREDAEIITEENPVIVNLVPPEQEDGGVTGIVIGAPSVIDNSISSGTILVEDEDGNVYEYTLPGASMAMFRRAAAAQEITRNEDGSIVIDFGSRVVIKKVTICVTGTESGGNLAEIAKVEFFQNFADRIPEPKLDIPDITEVTNTESDGQGYKNLTVNWTPQQNVTGYEVSVSGNGYNKTAVTSDTSYTFMGDSFNGTVKSFETYQVKVRSVNGDWKSGWSEVHDHYVTCTKVPPAPEYVTVTGGVKQLSVSWRCKFDAETFSVFYKKTNDTGDFTELADLKESKCTITGLDGGEEYTVYVVAHNRNGSSGKSKNAVGMPQTPTGVEFPEYKIIDVEDIKSIHGNNGKAYTIYKNDGTSVSNNEATPEDWNVLLDGDPNSYLYIPDWDSGVDYDNFRGPILELKEKKTIDTIRLSPSQTSNVHMNTVRIGYKDESGSIKYKDTKFYSRKDRQGRIYYEAVMDGPVTTDYLEIRTTTKYTRNYTICEVRLYNYDDLEDKTEALFGDVSHSKLAEGVTDKTIQALIDRANTLDSVSNEYHPHQEVILSDLNYAMTLYRDGQAGESIQVDNQVTANRNPSNGFAQALSDYQPLGYVAKAGSDIIIYVEDKDGKATQGSNVNLKLVATQYHPEVNAWQAGAIQLKAGRNEITVPKIGSYAKESGGSLYLEYTGTRGGNNYEVRVLGGTKIPVLTKDTNVEDYVSELRDYVSNLESLHSSEHGDIGYVYSSQECFLNNTEITMNNMMFSVPATQVWAAIKNDPVNRLNKSIEAMEQEIDYFYQFKGLNKSATDKDAYPFTRLNIRYHQMFTGAFMYAGGKHIGIEFGSVGGLFGTNPITINENGKKTGGNYSGWGIAHEIGHCINAAAYQRVEVTNNVFAQLAQTDETNATSRSNYESVYKAVVTGTMGHTGNLATQLAMYWQLHLAYDNDYSYKVYESIEEQQAGLFYARLESYLREPSKAPFILTSTSGDQGFMQAACAAANKDILDFFRAWGIYPNEATEQYAAQYEKESRKIQYIDNDSRLYRIENGKAMSSNTSVEARITTSMTDSHINGNKVTISLGNNNTNQGAMLGYEIRRNGKTVAFVTADKTSYTDVITTENNRAFVYTVTGIDRLLNETETVTLDEIKVSHDGSIDKSGWTVTTNMTSELDENQEYDPENSMGHTNEVESMIKLGIDNDTESVYHGTVSSGRPQIELALGSVKQITALKFTPDDGEYSNYRLFGYKVETSLDGENWTVVKEGDCYTGKANDPSTWVQQEDIIYNSDGSYVLYFNKRNDDGTMDPYMYTYDAAYVRLTATNMSSLALAELDILGPTSDDVDLKPEGYGRLKEDFVSGGQTALEAGKIVFYGDYKGDPSYSVVLLKDQDGNIINGEQLILASVTDKGYLGETSDGRWVYAVDESELSGVTSVMAELYRVQDAMTMKGQRLTSTSLHMNIPDECPDVTLSNNETKVMSVSEVSENLVKAAEAVYNVTKGEAQNMGLFYGDEGGIEGEIIGRVKLTADKDGNLDFEAMRQDTSVAMQVSFTGVSEDVQIERFTSDDFAFRTYRYEDDTLTLYGVCRKGVYNGGLFTGRLTNIPEGSKITAVASDLFDTSSNVIKDEDVLCEIVTPEEEPEPGETPAPSPSIKPSESPKPSNEPVPTPSNKPVPTDKPVVTPSDKPVPTDKPVSTQKPVPSESPAPTKSPVPSESPKPVLPFVDVKDKDWFADAVRFVYENGLMVGTGGNKFSPSMNTTRGMLVTILYRYDGSPDVTGNNPFLDVKDDAYYAKAVTWAHKNGIVAGIGSNRFAPESNITREQIVTILYRYAQYKDMDVSKLSDLSKYADANKVSDYALEAMKWACANGIVHGTGDNHLSPRSEATRAQIAQLMYRL